MKEDAKLKLTVTTLCCAVTVLFFLLYAYLFFFEHTSVYSSRHAHTFDTLNQYSVEQISDSSTPIGIRKEYRIALTGIDSSESCLCFYLVHHTADVYIDDELVHSLNISENNRINNTTGSNWVTIPIHEEDNGKELTIILTPLFKNVAGFKPEFLVGSHYSIVVSQFKEDIPQLFMALLCIILSVFIVLSQVYFTIQTKTKPWDMFYLAVLALMLGLWRMSATKSSPILFSNYTSSLGYISIGSLFLCSIFLQLYVSTFFTPKRRKYFLAITVLSCFIIFSAWLLQILNISDFEQMISVGHLLLTITIFSILFCSLLSRKELKQRPLFLILVVGLVSDIFCYYVFGSSTYVIFTVLTFVVYTIIVFVTNMLDTTKKAQIDSPTGLINKSRWNELTQNIQLDEKVIAITMIDLNNLKDINDSYGHEVGDRMISDFSKILKSSFPSSSVICRWGGDEFVIMTENKNALNNAQYIDKLHSEICDYNSKSENFTLSYAVGSCLSSEYPDADCNGLLAVADKRMYTNKIQSKAEQN